MGMENKKMNEKENDKTIQIGINRERLIRNMLIICIAFEFFFVLSDAFINYGKYTEIVAIRRLFNIAREDSLASWFGTTQTFMTGLTIWLIFLVIRHTSTPRKIIFGWCILAIFFTYMAVDDGAEIHERLGTALKTIVENSQTDPTSLAGRLLDIFPSYEWQILFLPVFGSIGLFMAIFLWREINQKIARILIFTGIFCFVTAVCLDFIEGLDKKHPLNIYTLIGKTYNFEKYTVRHFGKSLEEFLEMSGTTFFWLAFTDYLCMLMKNGITFNSPPHE